MSRFARGIIRYHLILCGVTVALAYIGIEKLERLCGSVEYYWWIYEKSPAVAHWLIAGPIYLVVGLLWVLIWKCIFYFHATGGRHLIPDRWRYARGFFSLLRHLRWQVADPLRIDPDSVEEIGVKEVDGIPLALYPDGRCYYRATRDRGNFMIIGAPGTGKTTAYLDTAVCRFGRQRDGEKRGSVLVFDVKGQSRRDTARVCEGDKRKVFCPSDPMHSCTFDPLRLVRQSRDPDELIQELEQIAECLVERDPKEPAFFAEGGRDFLVAVMLYLISRDHQISFYDVAGVMTTYSYDDVLQLLQEGGYAPAYDRVRKYTDMDAKNVSGCYGDAVKGVRIFSDRRMEALLDPSHDTVEDLVEAGSFDESTRRGSLSVQDLLAGWDLFIEIEPGSLQRYAPLLALCVQQIGSEALKIPDGTEGDQYPILLCIDEIAQYNRIPILSQLMALGRSRGVSVMLLMQSKSQLLRHYSEEEVGEMIDCTRYIALLSVKNSADQRYFAEMIGRRRTLRSTYSEGEGNQTGGRVSEGSGEGEEWVIDPAALGALEAGHRVFLISSGRHELLKTVDGVWLCRGKSYRRAYR